MVKSSTKVCMFLLFVVLLVVVVAGCNNNESGTTQNNSTPDHSNTSANADASSSETHTDTSSNAISDQPITLTYLISEHPSNPIFPDALVFKELERRTNIKLDFQIVPNDSYQDKLNVMIASGNIPDIVSVSGEQSIFYGEKGLFADLSSLIGSSTNLKSFIKPEEWLGLTSEEGNIYSIPYMIDTSKGLSSVLAYSWIVRKDWLDLLGMAEPKTTDEYYDMLVAFRDQIPGLLGKEKVYPLVVRNGLGQLIYELAPMFGTRRDYNIVNDKVVYTAVTNEYKDMLMYVNKLYENNLLDKEFLTLNTPQWEAKMVSGEAGSTWDTAVRADMLTGAMSEIDPNAELKILSPPKGPAGLGTYEILQATNYYAQGVAFSSKSKYINEAFQLFNYIFGSEGSDLINFGVEGVTYTVENGSYTFTDDIMEEIKTGLIPQSTLAKYGIGTWTFTFPYNVQADTAVGNVGPKVADLASRLQPSDISHPVPIGKFTSEQMSRLKEIELTLTAMRDEYSAKFMIGEISFDMWDDYVSEMKKNHYEEYEQILNEGYNAYLAKLAALQ